MNEKKHNKISLKRLLRYTVALLIIAVIIGAAVLVKAKLFKKSNSGNSANGLQMYTVKRQDLPIRVVESGDVKAIDSVDIKSEVEGRTTIINIVDEGTYIRAEDVNNMILVELDSSDIKPRLTQQEIEFLSAEASFAESKESYEIQKKQNISDIQKGRMKIRFASIDLKKYLGGDVEEQFCADAVTDPNIIGRITDMLNDPNLGGEALQKLKELKGEITQAENKFEQASDTLMWTNKLFEKDYVAATKRREDELAVESSKIQMEKAQIALELFKMYEFSKQVEKLHSDCLEAELEFDRTEASARSNLIKAEANLKSSEAQYLVQKERLTKLQKQLKACIIKAPAVGQVTYFQGRHRWSRQPIGVGEQVNEMQKIISIPDASKMKVEVKVHETWIDKVEPNQPAMITIAAFPEKEFTGRVIKKAPLADPQHWMTPDLKVYSTDVSIDGSHKSLKTGMTGKVEIIIDELSNVLAVPLQAVINHDGKKICFVGPDAEQREVEIGKFNESFVEIKSGLAEGEKVSLNPPRLAEPEESE